MSKAKVFCVGVSKTGTTSFGECMRMLGYRHLGGFNPSVAMLYIKNDIVALDRLVDAHDSFDDWPWPGLFPRYARKYPDAKFVLTLRKSPETWLRSYKNHCETHLFHWPGFERFNRAFFGAAFPHGREAEHLRAYLGHAQFVSDFFRQQPERLLELCFERDPVWTRLCAFLECAPPSEQVPHVNSAITGIAWRRLGKGLLMRGYGRLEKLRGIRCAIEYPAHWR